jgi:hypothetical protein
LPEFESGAKANKVRTAVTRFSKMLRNASMAGLVKLQCGVSPERQSPPLGREHQAHTKNQPEAGSKQQTQSVLK